MKTICAPFCALLSCALLSSALLFSATPAYATVTVTSPAPGSSVASPVAYAATSTTACSKGVSTMGIYVNNKLTFVSNGAALNTSLPLAPGTYNTVVEEWDHCGGASYTPVSITVKAGTGGGTTSGVTVSAPVAGSTVSSPVTYAATATTTCAAGVTSMGVYINNKLTYVQQGAALNTALPLAAGSYNTVVEEWDRCGGAAYTRVPLTVAASTPPGNPGVTVAMPAPNSTVSSPVAYQATAATSCAAGVASMGVYVNNKLVYVQQGASLSTSLSLAAGAEHTVVEEWDKCGGAAYTTINLTVTAGAKTLQSIAVTPASPTIAAGGTEQFAATARYSDGSTADVTSSAMWSSSNTGVATVAGGLATAVSDGSAQITASVNSVTGSTTLTVGAATPTGVNITTWHVDAMRSGLNSQETALTPSNVNPSGFGKLFSYALDGYAYAEPLVLSNVTVGGATHNVLYVATEHDSVYAFDADSYGSGAPLWHVSLLKSGEKPVTDGPIQPYQGITSTPVIDRSTNTLYVVSQQISTATGSTATFRLHALDVSTGAERFGGPVTVTASVAGSNKTAVNGRVSLPSSCIQRTALLLANGNVYMGFGSCHEGWVLGYSASTLQQIGAFSVSPNLDGEGTYASAGGVWMGSAGPVADSAGNIYVSTGNGPWDGKTAFSDSFLKLSPTLQLVDYFTPDDYAYLNCHDGDVAAGGLLMIPGTGNLIGGGKQGELYLVNSADMGKEQANDAGVVQELFFEPDMSAPYSNSCTDSSGTHTATVSSYEIFGTAAYFNGAFYLGVTPTASGVRSGIRQFFYNNGKVTYGTETSPSIQMDTRGTTPFVSSNGTSDGILWMIDSGLPLQLNSSPTLATLRAYDATDLGTELYDSSENSADKPGYGIRFTSPVVANGKVYMSSGHDLPSVSNPAGELDVYGLK